MKIRLLPVLLLATSNCVAAIPDGDCLNWTHRMLDNGSDACSDLCPQAQRSDNYDYRSGLSKAMLSRAALSEFLEYTGRSSIIGAGADAQACTLVAVLNKWGDDVFASVAQTQSKATRDRLMRLLDYAGVEQFGKRYPKTYALAEHDAEK